MHTQTQPAEAKPGNPDPPAPFRGPRWRHGLWLAALLLCALVFVWEWVLLDNIPTALTELQYAGNQNTARQVMGAWGEVGITPDRIQAAVLLDIPGLLLTGFVLALAAKRAERYFRDGAHEWKNYVIGGAVFAALCGLVGDLTLYAFLSDPLKHPAALPWVFFWITLKTFLFSAAALYAASGFGQSWWAGGFWDATRACGFSLFAALVGPGLLAFGHQGTAIFGAIYDCLSPTDPHPPIYPKPQADCLAYLHYHNVALRHYWELADVRPYGIALLAILFFSLMCWGAARYAVTYKEAEKAKDEKANGAGTSTQSGLGNVPHGLLFYLVSAQQRVDEKDAAGIHAIRRGKEKQAKGWKAGETWVPRFCGMAPSVLITLIILLADSTEIGSKWTALGVGITGGLVAVIIWLHADRRKKAEQADSPETPRPENFEILEDAREPGSRAASGKGASSRVPAETAFARKFSRAYQSASVVGGIVGAMFVLAGCFGGGHLVRITLDWGIGPLAAWFFSFSLVVPFFTWLVTAGRRYGKPFLALVLTYGFLINAADLNDDHGLRYKEVPPRTEGGKTTAPDPKALNQAFDDWLASDWRVEKWKKSHHDQPYPVVFVAAAGGGIVAGGVLTASMAELHQNKNTWDAEDHLFAISSVSGGSLGAVTYASLCEIHFKGPVRYDFRNAGVGVMTSDMLSPTVAALFGPEMVQRFLPFAVPNFQDRKDGYKNGYAMDRGRDLELAFEQALDLHTPDLTSARAESMLSAYPRPSEGGHLPALFLNTTCVETGQRMVISTLHPDAVPDDLRRLSTGQVPGPDGDWPLPFETLYDVNPLVDLPLTTAACLSARFPVVSPPAFLPQWRSQPVQGADGSILYPLTVKRRYVDGGYYENSGVETAMDVIDALQRQDQPRFRKAHHLASRPAWRPVLISVHMDGTNSSDQFARDDLSGKALDGLKGTALNPRRTSGFDEVLGPANAFFNGWGGPARPQLMRARRRLSEPNGKSDFVEMPFPDPAILSWYLSKTQYDLLRTQAGVLLNGRQGRRLHELLEPPAAKGPAAKRPARAHPHGGVI